MKLLYIHSAEKIKIDEYGNYYTDGSYNEEVWERYLRISKNLTVVFRIEKKVYDSNYAKCNFNSFNKDKIKLIEIEDLMYSIKNYINFLLRYRNKKTLKNAVINSDMIIVRLPCNEGNYAIKIAKKYNKKYIVEVVGCPFDTLWNHSIKGKLLAPIAYFNLRNSVKNAPYAMYVTNDYLQKKYPSNGKMVGCSDVVLENNDNTVLEKRLNKIKCLRKNSVTILCTVAAVNIKYKGQEHVIKAISYLNKKGYKYEYWLVGGGDNAYLKNKAKSYNVEDKVKFIGSVHHSAIYDILDSIDIYIQPSITEGLPRALIEAMSRGCPCIGSNTGGIPELLSNYSVFKKGDLNDLIKIINIFDNKVLREEAKKNFYKSKEFYEPILNERRNIFYDEIIKSQN